jgi:hypothetical protein
MDKAAIRSEKAKRTSGERCPQVFSLASDISPPSATIHRCITSVISAHQCHSRRTDPRLLFIIRELMNGQTAHDTEGTKRRVMRSVTRSTRLDPPCPTPPLQSPCRRTVEKSDPVVPRRLGDE